MRPEQALHGFLQVLDVPVEKIPRDLREHLGFDPSPEERAELLAEHTTIMAEVEAEFAARRGARSAPA